MPSYKENEMKIEELKFYAIKNSQGQYFHRKGYSGYGDTWSDDASQARIYTKLGQARGQVTYFSSYTQFPVPTIVEISIGEIKELDETDRIAQAKAKKAHAIAAQEKRNKEAALKKAIQDMKKAQDAFDKLKD